VIQLGRKDFQNQLTEYFSSVYQNIGIGTPIRIYDRTNFNMSCTQFKYWITNRLSYNDQISNFNRFPNGFI